MKTLHVLNGDATVPGFKQAHFTGDILVWREVMSEGPVAGDIYSRQFWAERSAFICENFQESPENYRQKVLDEMERLKNVTPYSEVVLWFEFDLHCQINLLAILQLLQESDLRQTAISLVCPEDFPGVDDFHGLGELDGEQLASLWPGRVFLEDKDLTLAAEAWEAYASGDADRIAEVLNRDFGKLPLLKKALKMSIHRLEKDSEGLNPIEQKIVQLHSESFTDREELYRRFSRTEKAWGMGDAEFYFCLDNLVKKGFIK